MGIDLNGDFPAKFEALKTGELKKADREGEFEVGVHFENNLLSSLSFNKASGPWSDHYWIMFPNPKKVTWKEVRKAVKAGIDYLKETSQPSDKDLAMMD